MRNNSDCDESIKNFLHVKVFLEVMLIKTYNAGDRQKIKRYYSIYLFTNKRISETRQ